MYPKTSRTFQRLCMTISAALYRRFHRLHAETSPWKFAAAGDPRVPSANKLSIGHRWCLLRRCCKGPLFGRKLFDLGFVRSADDFTAGFTQTFFHKVFGSVDGTVADVEFQHHRNRVIVSPACGGMSWSSFAAASFNREICAQVQACREAQRKKEAPSAVDM